MASLSTAYGGPDRERDLAILTEAARALVDNGMAAGRRALRPIAGEVWSLRIPPTRTIAVMDLPYVDVSRRSCSSRLKAQVSCRDGFVCRYCGGRIIPRQLLVALSTLYPAEIPYYSHYKAGTVHRVYWTLAAEADHLVPGSRGGPWSDPANLVTACAYCNTRKRERLLDEIGWQLQRSGDRTWDGLTRYYRAIWEAAGSPNQRYHRPFIEVFEAAADRHDLELVD